MSFEHDEERSTRLSRREIFARAAVIGAVPAIAAITGSGPAAAAPALQTPAGLAPGTKPKVAILIDEPATLIDFAGIWQALIDVVVAKVAGFEVFSVGPEIRPLKVYGSLLVQPNYTFANAPQADVIYMGAQRGVQNASQEKLDWIRKAHQNATLTTSACTGSFLLAQAGLLDGLQATTHHAFFDRMAATYPKVKLVRDRRIVTQGRIVTAGGESCSLDLGLWLIAHYYGNAVAATTAAYMEYAPNPPLMT